VSRNEDGDRRVSIEQRRIFRTARLEFVAIGRIAGMDPAAGELMRDWDIAAQGLMQLSDWSEEGLHALMLVRPLVVVGCAEGKGPLNWLANADILLAAQNQWPKETRVPVLILAPQITPTTRIQAVGAGVFAACAPSIHRALPPGDLFRLWQALIRAKLNPLSSSNKMTLVRATGCDPRKLPAVRASKPAQDTAA